jgi:hypothetical protein
MSGTTSFIQRNLDFTFTLQDGTFTGTGSNSVTVSGLRATVTVTRVGGAAFNQATASIYGLTLDLMNDLSTLGSLIANNKRNGVAIYAGDAKSGMGLVFSGTMNEAWANLESAPDASLDISAQTGLADAIAAVSPASYQNGADVATIIRGIASQMKPARAFENNGVSVFLSNAYFPGTATQQIKEAAEAAGIISDDDGQTISIWPVTGSRGGAIPLISPDTGMIGYPKFTRRGVDVVTVFNPNIVLGGKVQVDSIIRGAKGTWRVHGMVHNLQSQTPNGLWTTAVRLVDPVIYSGRTS